MKIRGRFWKAHFGAWFLFVLAPLGWADPSHHRYEIQTRQVGQIPCWAYLEGRNDLHPATGALTAMALDFARKHDLPVKFLEVGPPERRVSRLYVGLNYWNWDVYLDYLRTFNLESTPELYRREGVSGVLDLVTGYEPFQPESSVKPYITLFMRARPDFGSPIFWHGHEAESLEYWWNQNLNHPANRGHAILGFSHLIGLNDAEKVNVWKYLYHPELRGPQKSYNCASWIPCIELDHTDIGVPDPERGGLFSKLGISRTVESNELVRRLTLGANERHGVVFALLNGPAGIDAFENRLAAMLPPDPQLPYNQVLRDVDVRMPEDLRAALAPLPDGARIFVPIAAGASPDALLGLVDRAKREKKGATIVTLVNGLSEATLVKASHETDGLLQFEAFFLGGNLRKLHREGRVLLHEGALGDFARAIRDEPKTHDPTYHFDAIFVRVSPPDAEGRYSLGSNHDMILSIIRSQPGIRVIAEINPNVPFTEGDNFLRASEIQAFFRSEAALAGPVVVPLQTVELRIGHFLGQLVPNGATLQVGIGNVFGGLEQGMAEADRRGIHIFSEMMGDSLMSLIKSGRAVDATTGFLYGSRALYAWADHNPKVRVASTEEVNDPDRVARIPDFIAINTALQVSLSGDVNATHGPGGARISSVGGQPEFMAGASRSPGGKAIIAIRSTAKSETLSTITDELYTDRLTTPAANVTHVVTEYGVAELKGRSAREKAIALIGIAHPKFRRELFARAVARGVLGAADAERIDLSGPALENVIQR